MATFLLIIFLSLCLVGCGGEHEAIISVSQLMLSLVSVLYGHYKKTVTTVILLLQNHGGFLWIYSGMQRSLGSTSHCDDDSRILIYNT